MDAIDGLLVLRRVREEAIRSLPPFPFDSIRDKANPEKCFIFEKRSHSHSQHLAGTDSLSLSRTTAETLVRVYCRQASVVQPGKRQCVCLW